MAQPWITLDRVLTPDGTLELRQRGTRDFLITLDNLVLMNSHANRSELALGELGCAQLKNHPAPRVLVGGLGMGCTLRAVLDALPVTAAVTVAELNPVILAWCRGPLAPLTAAAADDPRVAVVLADVADVVKAAARGPEAEKYDAILFDLYRGPHHHSDRVHDPLYGRHAVLAARNALRSGGTFAIWGESFDGGFDRRLREAGFVTRHVRPGKGGLRHVVFLGELAPG